MDEVHGEQDSYDEGYSAGHSYGYNARDDELTELRDKVKHLQDDLKKIIDVVEALRGIIK